MKQWKRGIVLFVLTAAIAATVLPAGIIDGKLSTSIASEPGPFNVIVTFRTLSDAARIRTLGVPNLILRSLPMCGAILTKDQIRAVAGWESVESIYLNSPLRYFNHDAGAMTGAHYVQDVLKYKGKGVTVVIIDSGIDATHPDLPFHTKVIENVKVVSDLGTAGTSAFIEGIINTDNTSGHGTHVAGTVAGSGAASEGDERDPYYYRGVAPEASLVGIGAGEGLHILNALLGFDYAISTKDRFNTAVISNSWGNSSSQYDPNDPISKASYAAYRKGIVVTFAAGNDGPGDNTMSSYSINPWVIGVAAGTKTGVLADFSSRGESTEMYEHPDITAPGASISSTRAVGTPVAATGPVVNINHPEYYTYYSTLSGTSMATPFVAGTVALLLNANPQLSPDQIEEIIMSTATPMPGYQPHQTGAGYINVRAAVEKAVTTKGNRMQFLAGDTKWSAQGAWTVVQENNADIGFYGSWQSVTNQLASGGAYAVSAVKTKGKKVLQQPFLQCTFFGTAVKLEYPTNAEGGTAEVFIDGLSRGTISFYSTAPGWGVRSAYAGLSNTSHTLEVRGSTGRMYLDNITLDGKIFPNTTQFTDESETYTGSLGPSVQGIPETRLIPFTVHTNTVQLAAELAWTGGVDLDLYLLDPNGIEVTRSASLDNPEGFTYWVTAPGTYTYKIVGYATAIANFSLTSTQTRTSPAPQASPKSSGRQQQTITPRAVPTEFSLSQNYPNPFNPVTTITYSVPEDQHIRLKVFDLIGMEIAVLDEGARVAGTYSVRFNAERLSSGLYFYVLTTSGGFHSVKRMTLVK